MREKGIHQHTPMYKVYLDWPSKSNGGSGNYMASFKSLEDAQYFAFIVRGMVLKGHHGSPLADFRR